MCGGVPFAEDAEDPYKIQVKITKNKFHIHIILKQKGQKFYRFVIKQDPVNSYRMQLCSF
ncbi:unnamed protein product [Paramecium primaurelia]|uniref:Uncharacterized protein n=1 Tax=Paramecium primaurelia TaxID=5886 RepID=A0A8S1MFT7_PARPR|nr:unnamed protein product [Paramecium primaurelia]